LTRLLAFAFAALCWMGPGLAEPVARWDFDEAPGQVAADASGSVAAPRVHGASRARGVPGTALSFDGKDDWVDCGNHKDLNVGTGDFSVEAWIRTSAAETNDMIVGKRAAGDQPHWSVFIEGARVRAYLNKGGNWEHADWAVGGRSVVDGKWRHVVAVFERSAGSIRVHIDGALDGAAQIGKIPKDVSLDNDGHVAIGAAFGGTGNAFPGLIDAVALHKEALGAEEIRRRFELTAPALPGTGAAPPTDVAGSTATPASPPAGPGRSKALGPGPIRFGITADPHSRKGGVSTTRYLNEFVDAMVEWQPHFTVDLGDFAIQMKEGKTTPEMHDGQIENVKYNLGLLARLPCPRRLVMGNHCVGWIKGGDEIITPQDLIERGHAGEDITKIEFLAYTGMPHRYYSFEVNGCLFIVLDGNNPRGPTAAPAGRDGVAGAYWIDDTQKAWVAAVLAAHRDKRKIVFCHQELHHTPVAGSGHGGDVPFEAVGKPASYVDNGWELRKLFAEDGKVLACFFGHRHRNRWTVYDGVHYITLAALHWEGSFAKVTIGDQLLIEGGAKQKSYTLPIKR